MPVIIALMGKASKGKSTTFGFVYKRMKQESYTLIQDKKRKNSKDFFVIFEKRGKKNRYL